MIKKYLFFVFFLFPFVCYGDISILGYPRSGTHLLCYSLSQILDTHVVAHPKSIKWRLIRHYPKDSYKSGTTPLGDVLFDKIPSNSIFFSHYPRRLGLSQANQKEDFLIVIVRDYHECFARHFGIKNQNLNKRLLEECTRKIENAYDDNTINYDHAINYPNILRCYDEWNEETRFLIYYEDLISDFDSVMSQCLKKLKIKGHHLEEFLVNFETEMKNSSKIYQYRQGGSKSNNDPKFYQKNTLSLEDTLNMDKSLKTHFPHLWKTYLSRYEIKAP